MILKMTIEITEVVAIIALVSIEPIEAENIVHEARNSFRKGLR